MSLKIRVGHQDLEIHVKTGANIFTKIKNTDRKKKFFSDISFQAFLICAFSENIHCFVRTFL